jgi:magnesium chelatase family protein
VRAAVLSSGFAWPNRGITVNLAPTSVRKTGAGLDMAIAIGVLVATEQLSVEAADRHAFIGELGLDGTVRRVAGVAPMVDALDDIAVVVPPGNAVEAQIAARGPVLAGADLATVVACLTGGRQWERLAAVDVDADLPPLPDLCEVRGQAVARRALEIAAAGGHHLLFIGSPGSGKTMLAQRLAGLLPPLDREQALETTMVHSAAGVRLPPGGLVRQPPFRAPHHTTSVVGLVGGGSHHLRPGEVSLANHGVLFMDELGEFGRAALEGLREPLEEGVIRVARAQIRAVMPARFLLVAATNPCPCGGGAPGACECDDVARARYLRRLSGPITDRFDLRVVVHRPAVDDLLGLEPGEPSAPVRQRVLRARQVAIARAGKLNAALTPDELDTSAPLSEPARSLLRDEVEHDRLTGRGYHRVRKVARTIADLDGESDAPISVADVELALHLRASLRPSSIGATASRWIA